MHPGTPTANPVSACSRCDGPVSEHDLIDGSAVRIDSQPVCQVCIETLPPALRVQINRVRALKGLAVTTYRVRHPTVLRAELFSFTNAGMLMLHRRSLDSGTEFTTPDLPSEETHHQAAAVQQSSSSNRSEPPRRGLLIAGLVGAGAVVLGGIIAMVLASSPEALRPGAAQVSGGTPGNSPQPGDTQSVARLVPVEPSFANVPVAISEPLAQPAAGRTISDYLNGHTSVEALAAAERDDAPAELRSRLIETIIAERTTELGWANDALRSQKLDRAKKFLQQTRLPTGHPEFADLLDAERVLTLRLSKAEPVAASVSAPAPVPIQAPIQAPNPVKVEPPVDAAVIGAPVIDAPVLVAPVGPEPVVNGKPKLRVTRTVWSGSFLPKGPLLQLSTTDKIPAPWPTMVDCVTTQFLKSAYSASSKKRHQLELTISAEQVVEGGVGLVLNPGRVRQDKSIHVLRGEQVVATVKFSDLSWRFVAIPLPADGMNEIKLIIEDEDEINVKDVPFWLGPVLLTKGELPSEKSVRLLPATMLIADVWLNDAQGKMFNAIIQSLAKNRRKNTNAAMPFSDAKVLLGNYSDGVRTKLSEELRTRWTFPSGVTHAIVPFDLDPAKTFLDPDTQPSEKQTFTVLIPNGLEAGLSAAEWAKRVRDISARLLAPPAGRANSIPVWVMGSLDGRPVTPDVWSAVRVPNQPWVVIDLTLAGPLADAHGEVMIADALKTLTYELRQVQVRAKP